MRLVNIKKICLTYWLRYQLLQSSTNVETCFQYNAAVSFMLPQRHAFTTFAVYDLSYMQTYAIKLLSDILAVAAS